MSTEKADEVPVHQPDVEGDVLIPVSSARHSAFMGHRPVLVNFIDGENIIPNSDKSVTTGINVQLRLEGTPVAPMLKFAVTVVKQTESSCAHILHNAVLEFGVSPKDEILDLKYKTQFTAKPYVPGPAQRPNSKRGMKEEAWSDSEEEWS
ncbi:hypothetical protein P170DRAFT_431790 [Aspergillus steynii IBT 23096]|uniref:Uncharacterized protein n=1 Tax=Aspergillus steynii IBT 23096 TaxID=1392250 RepID=A0A2I2GMN9_9EURO|nr:uncharacterized protein P170DRAFT_431790 [Aspergillus steynii IBT 23096]PLB54135.1 hypothetical protein P170DRAFT_431790 [Aspergillus steynii IBT 23096]